MRGFFRFLKVTLAVLVSVVLVLAIVVYVVSERRLKQRFDVPTAEVPVPSDSASIARGEHVAMAFTSCALCHGADGGGAILSNDPKLGVIAGPNLTRGRGGIGGQLSTSDWVRAIRHGVRPDSTSLIVMPSEVFTHLSLQDLGSIIAYYRQLPPVDREMPKSGFGPLGRTLLAAGKLNILVAGKTPRVTPPVSVMPAATAEYGRYIADVSGCHGCHGYGLSGGRVAGPPGLPPASNLTPSGIGSWTEADFVRAMRDGKCPDGRAIDEFMPWQLFRRMTDDELHATWLYLRSVPAKEFGHK